MQATTNPQQKKTPIRFKYKPKFLRLLFAILVFALLSYLSINDAIHNDRGLVINNIFHFSRRGATVLYSFFALCFTLIFFISIIFFYTNITTKKEIYVFDSQVNLPKSAFSSEMISIKYKHILSLKMRTLEKQRSLLIEHINGTTVISEEMLENKAAFEKLTHYLAVYNSI
ncbi:hypothetical protein [Undibacterium flavidum]|uniref:Uncharacterized protein n=1 Tax=Undibacterium flavidum TaxID=2762297 RepID=A0ABR6YG20_9BURK|nr:hypothetical protein [Undibacterium flavidum]MBC3875483.1 hypothetical protein [Undibacterium flavidum]